MLSQRVALGLATSISTLATGPVSIVPVLAVGSGKLSPVALSRAWEVQEVLASSLTLLDSLEPFELWRLDEHGGISDRWLARPSF
jgi:hypothetical protein